MNDTQKTQIRITKSVSLDLLYQLSLITDIKEMNEELTSIYDYIIGKSTSKDTGIRAQYSLEYAITISGLISFIDGMTIYTVAEELFNWVEEKGSDYSTYITAGSAINRTINFGISGLLKFNDLTDIFKKAEGFNNWMLK